MSDRLPEYLSVSADALGSGSRVKVHVLGNAEDVARDMARAILSAIESAADEGRGATLILPVGPVDQFPLLAEAVNSAGVSLRDVLVINMDEYLDENDLWIDPSHPLSFRGFMQRLFYDRLDAALAPPPSQRVFPDPAHPDEIGQLIDARGGVDVCFGGIGINGHLAFNEPPTDESVSAAEFAEYPTRVIDLACETRTINAVTVGGEIGIVPRRAVTIGMREILASRALHFYGNRPWQRAVVRRALHGPLTAGCPASLLRTHGDATLSVADYVAEPPQIALR